MKRLLAHAAIAALVGWYLLAPPVNSDRALSDRPLGYWTQIGAFDTAAECEHLLNVLSVSVVEAQIEQAQQGNPVTHIAMTDRINKSLCVSGENWRTQR